MKTIRTFAILGLLLAGCGNDPVAGQVEGDGGTGGAQASGTGGAAPDGGGAGGMAPAVDGGGSGGTMGTGGVVGTGGAQGSGGMAGTGGAVGTGGVSGTGGNQGSGGTTADTACVDPMGWKIESPGSCLSATAVLKKDGRICRINCRSVQPSGAAGNYIGPPFHPECVTPPGSDLPGAVCVGSCGECS